MILGQSYSSDKPSIFSYACREHSAIIVPAGQVAIGGFLKMRCLRRRRARGVPAQPPLRGKLRAEQPAPPPPLQRAGGLGSGGQVRLAQRPALPPATGTSPGGAADAAGGSAPRPGSSSGTSPGSGGSSSGGGCGCGKGT